MKNIGWFLLVILLLHLGLDIYAYHFYYIPERAKISALVKENKTLKADIFERLKKLKNPVVDTVFVNSKNTIQNKQPLDMTFPLSRIFKHGTIKTEGKELLKEIYANFNNTRYDSILVIINPRVRNGPRMALSVKKYLVSLGAGEKSVWARLDRHLPTDSLFIKLQ